MNKFWLAILSLFFVGCDATSQPKKPGPSKESLAIINQAPLEVREKLKELNHEETMYGNKALDKGLDYHVSGETGGIINMLKEELNELGYDLIWENSEYVLRPKPQDPAELAGQVPVAVKEKLKDINRLEAMYGNKTQTRKNETVSDDAIAIMMSYKISLNSFGYDAIWKDSEYVLRPMSQESITLFRHAQINVKLKLQDLNHLESEQRDKTQKRKKDRTPGEVQAEINELKGELNELGYDVTWEDPVYVLHSQPQHPAALSGQVPVLVSVMLEELNRYEAAYGYKNVTCNGTAVVRRYKMELYELGYNVNWEDSEYVLHPMPKGSITLYRMAPDEVKEKLQQLNDWESAHGNKTLTEKNDDAPDDYGNYLNRLKGELNELGYDVTWEAPIYVLRLKSDNQETEYDSKP